MSTRAISEKGAAELIDHFGRILDYLTDEYESTGEITARREDGELAQVAVALVSETFAAATATKALAKQAFDGDAMTCARRAFEHAVTVAWLTSNHGSVDKFVRLKGHFAAAALARALAQSGTKVDPQLVVQALANAPSRRALDAALTNFEAMCNLFHPRLYIVYRLASRRAHPSLSALDRALNDKDANRRAVADSMLAMHLAVTSVVWAGRALDRLHVGQPFKDRLRRAARELCISPVLYPNMPDDGSKWPA